ncbi:MAG: glycosyltransferase [Chloroflexi bacterium]|nr:MAG: glycosyltransferase [Chloroflexota bacterium]
MAKRGASHRLRRLIPGTHPARRIQVAIHPEVLPLGLALPSEPALAAQNGVIRIAFVASAVPRRCGIATFTADLMAAVKAADPAVRCIAAAIDEPNATHAYGPEVRWRIRQGDKASYRGAARAINESSADVVNLQHEFGLYGVWRDGAYDDHCVPMLEELKKPVITTLHTVLPKPEAQIREVVRRIAERSSAIVVMAETAARLLGEVYGIERPSIVIPHGMPAIVPRGRRRLKRQLGMDHRTIISTFGLVDPRKGLEYMIAAMPQIAARHPNTLYLIVGQTHPELLRKDGERYRNELVAKIESSGMAEHVRFVNQYLRQREIVDYLLATDVYVTPYLDLNQITSGTLAYALGAGKAIVSTRYLHAAEALADGRGLLVDVRDADGLVRAVLAILDDPALKAELERRAYEYGKEMAWPNVGRRVLALTRELLGHAEVVVPAQASPVDEPEDIEAPVHSA